MLSTVMRPPYKTSYYTYNILFTVIILFGKFNYYDFSTSVNKGYYTNTSSTTNLLRFRDFAPRNYVKMERESLAMATNATLANDRKSRGFQFHADEKDVSIELEFIVPFVRIPIERSMAVTKTAFRNLFNLNVHSILTTGALIAVGGIFAIVLKFFFTPFAGGYGAGLGYRKASRISEEHPSYSWRNQYQYDNSSCNINCILKCRISSLNYHPFLFIL